MSDLFENHIVGFPTRRLIYVLPKNNGSGPQRQLALEPDSINSHIYFMLI